MGLRIPGYTWIGSWTGGNDYVDNGQQPKILLHMTVSTGLSMSYAQGHPYPPQSWANPYTGDKWQSIELDRAGMALYQPPYNLSWMNKNYYCSQTELVGYPEVNVETYTDEQCRWIGENVIAPIWQAFQSHGINVDLNNVRYHTDSSSSASEYWHGRMGDEEFFNYNGILCHIDAFGNDHWDCSVERTDMMAHYARQFLGQGGQVPVAPPSGGGGGETTGNPGSPTVGGWGGVYLSNFTEHPSVGTWQAGMNNLGYGLDVDNQYGNMSESACIQLQQANGLDADGVVGPMTWDVTFGGSAPPSSSGGGGSVGTSVPPWPGTYLENYTEGFGTAQWQQQMANRGWSIDVDDQYGSQSEEVCRAFQSEKGLDVDGIVGPQTWEAAWTAPVT